MIFCRFSLAFLLLFLVLSSSVCAANDKKAESQNTYIGVPVVMDSGTMMIQGQNVALWGIKTLAPDQQCWQDSLSWYCGEQATYALKHFVAGRSIRCLAKPTAPDEGIRVQCFRKKGDKEVDIASFLVAHGWALDDPANSNEHYAMEQDDARDDKKGVWSSRFQSAEDWKNGIPNYVNDEPENSDQDDDDSSAE
jgi:endonuclease YncB( thermonuclease family)